MSDTPPEPPIWPPNPPDRYHVRMSLFDGSLTTEHDLGAHRIKQGEVATLYLDEECKPFVSVIPECEAG